jgi:hypothetical protein
MAALSEWLQIMLAEIARKRDDSERAREEDAQRQSESTTTDKSADGPRSTGEQRVAGR